MNKVKLLYDVIMTMKDKESFNGNLKVEGSRDQVKIFDLNNVFEKSMAEGRMKAQVSLETDCAGKKVKHESSTEFDTAGFSGCERHSFKRGVFHHWHGRHHHHGRPDGVKCGGIKGKLSRLAFLVSMLHSMKVEEQQDKSMLVSLDFNDIPREMQTLLQEKLHQHRMHHDHCSHGVFKEFSGLEMVSARLAVRINKNHEVEKILLNAEGKAKDQSGEPHPLNLKAELSLAW